MKRHKIVSAEVEPNDEDCDWPSDPEDVLPVSNFNQSIVYFVLQLRVRFLPPFKRPFSRWTLVSRCLLKQRMMEVVVTTGAISRAKLQSNHHHQHPVFYRPDALPVAQPTVSKH